MSKQEQKQIVPPTMTLLRRAWDVDRFIVLGSLEKVVAVFFCSTLAQFSTGIKPSDSALSANNKQPASKKTAQDVEATNRAYLIEAARMEALIRSIAVPVSRFCTVYLCDTSVVRDFDVMYELHAEEPFALMFFYRNKHVKVDVGTGNYNKINFAVDDREELIQIVEAVFMQAKQGKPVVETGMTYSDFAGRGT